MTQELDALMTSSPSRLADYARIYGRPYVAVPVNVAYEVATIAAARTEPTDIDSLNAQLALAISLR